MLPSEIKSGRMHLLELLCVIIDGNVFSLLLLLPPKERRDSNGGCGQNCFPSSVRSVSRSPLVEGDNCGLLALAEDSEETGPGTVVSLDNSVRAPP